MSSSSTPANSPRPAGRDASIKDGAGGEASPPYVETFRTQVRLEDCDALGHMNVQHYYRAISEGMFDMMTRLGLPPDEIARRRLSFAVVRAETDFRRELHEGSWMALDSTILTMGRKLVHFHHRLWAVDSGELAMVTDYKCVPLDLEKRQSVPVPDDMRRAALAAFPGLHEV